MRSVVLHHPMTVAGTSFESWDPKRLKTIDCVKVGDILYFIPITYSGDVAKRDLENAKAVHVVNVKEWGPSVTDLPPELMQRATPQPPASGKK